MKTKEVYATIAVVLFYFHVLGVRGAETNEENDPHYEYIQIFRSIPVLFEYLLNVVEVRPEILENNDVTLFKRNIDGENSEEIESYDDRDKRENHETVNKRDTDNTKEARTTVAYEYGNSNVIMKGLDEFEERKEFTKRFSNNENFDDFDDDDAIDGLFKRKAVYKLYDDTNDMLHKYGKVFYGFEHMFGLDLNPEDIEECMITTEHLLEEYNSKKEEN